MRKLLLFMIFALILTSCAKEKKSEEAALKMQEFVVNIANYAHGIRSDFDIVPQNGIELAYVETAMDMGVRADYVQAVAGFGVEELFFDGSLLETDDRIDMLRQLKADHTIMVADFLSESSQLAEAVQLNTNEGFLCFPRSSTNYDYKEIPAVPVNENSNDINALSQAQNYLYLISTDNFADKTSMLDAIRNSNYDLVLIDLYFEETALTAAEVNSLKVKANGGIRRVIAYINVGAAESWRYYWQDDWKLHKPDWLKKKYDGYDDEIWVEYWNTEWHDIIYGNDNSYIKRIIDAGFDGAYLDNVEAYYFLYYN